MDRHDSATLHATKVDELVAAKRYQTALEALKNELKRRPDDESLVTRMAEIYSLAAQKERAARLLQSLTGRLARKRHTAKAIVAAKKLQQLDPSYDEIDIMLASTLYEEPGPAGSSDPLFSPEDIEDLDIGAGWKNADPEESPSVHSQSSGESAVVAGSGSPLFDGFNQDELVAVIRGLTLISFEPGDVIVTQGDPRNSVFILTSGRAKAFVRQEHGYVPVRELGEGDFFGEISLLSGGARTATITAATHCELLELDRDTVEAIAVSHPRVIDVLQRFSAQRLASDRTLS